MLVPTGGVWTSWHKHDSDTSASKHLICLSLSSPHLFILNSLHLISLEKHILKYCNLIILLVLQKQAQGCSLGSHVYLINSWNMLFIMNFSLDLTFLVCLSWAWTIHTSPFTGFAKNFNWRVCMHTHTHTGNLLGIPSLSNLFSVWVSPLTLHAALRLEMSTSCPRWNMSHPVNRILAVQLPRGSSLFIGVPL